ncbi:MAG: PilC/PilY family type IV pilus protein [Desulfobacterota bacterium]|nr:PilC/PilY family type IV pilus protein [Thermodesulfobacteriota bacterium]
MKKRALFFIGLLILFPLSDARGADTDLYVLDQTIQQVPPDILIVLDLSGSMRWTPAGERMYITSSNKNDCRLQNIPFYATSRGGTYCDVPDDTNDYNSSTNDYPIYSNSACSGPFYKTYSSSDPNRNTNCSRVEIAKRAIKSILDANDDGQITSRDQEILSMRMGYMRFYDCGSDTGTDYNSGCNRLVHPINTPYATIWDSISNAGGKGGTHLANALKEARLYLNAHKAEDNARNCRKKFVILISDGEDTLACNGNGSEAQSDQYKRRRETIAAARALANDGYKVFVIGFGAPLPLSLRNTLNWAAYYGGTNNREAADSISGTYLIPPGQLYPAGMSSCSNHTYDPGSQNISGYAYFAETPSQLEQALFDIRDYILNLLAESSSYVAPVVPISQMESYSSQNRMYLAMFKPTLKSLWLGNIKKFGIADRSSGNIKKGDILDVLGRPAITTLNEIDRTARSYWSSGEDGGEVVRGGVGEQLANRDLLNDPRKIYTYVGISEKKLLTEPENAFTVANSNITYSMLGLSNDPVRREKIIKFVHGFDSFDWDENTITEEKRKASYLNEVGQEITVPWILGAFIHSRPLVIHYPNRSVIFAGANDGMLHAFDDATGRELWAFVPPSVLPKLKDFETNLTLQTSVDGSPKAYIERNSNGTITKAILIFGLRRGGDRYIALDVTNPEAPRFLWEIGPSTSGFERLGQTWSTPVLKPVAHGDGKKVVAFVAGGYDPCNDPNMSCGSGDQKGNAIYAIDISNGQLLWQFSKTNDSRMVYSIPSDISAIDINGDGKIDRLYVGDMGGQLWRFDIGNLNNLSAWTGKVIFRANSSSADKRKFFYPPEVSPGPGFQWVFIGTGDREHPKQETGTSAFPTQNRLYAIKDSNPSTPLSESNLVDVTSDILQKPNPTSDDLVLREQTRTQLANWSGWFITLENKGEKCLASPLIYSRTVYFTTFTPSYPNEGDICFLGEGTGRVYALQFQTGAAMFNYDLTNDLPGQPPTIYKTDRSMIIGAGIPSQVVISIIEGDVVGYIGVGGGVFSPEELGGKVIQVLYWRTVH